jgi:signal transduction histidine kinase
VMIVVEDDGLPVIGAPLVSSGFGLTGMRERVALFGGTIDVGPQPDGGFRLQATLPTRAAQAVPA